MPSFMINLTRLPRRPRLAAILLLAASGVAGCDDSGRLAPNCPQTGILSDAADLTRFRGTGTDLTDMVVDGRITGISGKCSLQDATHLKTVLSVDMDLTRGPASTGRAEDVTYFVSITRGGEILNKGAYTLHVTFDNNASRVRLRGDQIDLLLPVGDNRKGSDYRVLVGFQLSPDELAFNRQRGTR